VRVPTLRSKKPIGWRSIDAKQRARSFEVRREPGRVKAVSCVKLMSAAPTAMSANTWKRKRVSAHRLLQASGALAASGLQRTG